MGRKQKNTVEFFSHDAVASDGRTVTILESCFGFEGYAAWFKLLERISDTENHQIDVRNPADLEFLAGKMHFKVERLIIILNKMADLQAIDRQLWSQKIIWCQNFVDRLEVVYDKRKRPKPLRPEISDTEIPENISGTEKAIVSTEKAISATEIPISVAEIISVTEMPQSRVEKSRVKKSKEEESREENSSSSEKIVDKSELNIYQLYDQEIGTLTAGISTLLKDAEIQYPVEWIAEAIKQAVQANKRSWSYIKAILENCKAEKHSPGSRSGKKTSAKDDPGYYFGGKYGHVVKH